jgi:hypothetical protein
LVTGLRRFARDGSRDAARALRGLLPGAESRGNHQEEPISGFSSLRGVQPA